MSNISIVRTESKIPIYQNGGAVATARTATAARAPTTAARTTTTRAAAPKVATRAAAPKVATRAATASTTVRAAAPAAATQTAPAETPVASTLTSNTTPAVDLAALTTAVTTVLSQDLANIAQKIDKIDTSKLQNLIGFEDSLKQLNDKVIQAPCKPSGESEAIDRVLELIADKNIYAPENAQTQKYNLINEVKTLCSLKPNNKVCKDLAPVLESKCEIVTVNNRNEIFCNGQNMTINHRQVAEIPIALELNGTTPELNGDKRVDKVCFVSLDGQKYCNDNQTLPNGFKNNGLFLPTRFAAIGSRDDFIASCKANPNTPLCEKAKVLVTAGCKATEIVNGVRQIQCNGYQLGNGTHAAWPMLVKGQKGDIKNGGTADEICYRIGNFYDCMAKDTFGLFRPTNKFERKAGNFDATGYTVVAP